MLLAKGADPSLGSHETGVAGSCVHAWLGILSWSPSNPDPPAVDRPPLDHPEVPSSKLYFLWPYLLWPYLLWPYLL